MLRVAPRLFSALGLRISRAFRLFAAPLCPPRRWLPFTRTTRPRPARHRPRPTLLSLSPLEPRFLPGDGSLGSLIAAGYVLPDGSTVDQASQSLAAIAPSSPLSSATLSDSSASVPDYCFLSQDGSSGLPLPDLSSALASLTAVSLASTTSSAATSDTTATSLVADTTSDSAFNPDLSAGLNALWGTPPSASSSSPSKQASLPTPASSNGPNLAAGAAGAGGGASSAATGSTEVNGSVPASGTAGSSSVSTAGTGGSGAGLSQSMLTAMTAGPAIGATNTAGSVSASSTSAADNGLPAPQTSGVITPLVLNSSAASSSADPHGSSSAAGDSSSTATPDASTTGMDSTGGAVGPDGSSTPTTAPALQPTDPTSLGTSSGQPAGGSTPSLSPAGSASPAFSAPSSGTSPGTSLYLPQTSTTTSLATSASTVAPSQTVTFTATVAVSGGSGVPTGTVAFYDGATLLATQNLSVANSLDQASYSTSSLALGSHTITAIYGGGPTFAPSSNALTQAIAPALTTLSLTSSSTSLIPGQTQTLTATLSAASGSPLPLGTPTGTVTFTDTTTATTLGQAPVVPNGSQFQAVLTNVPALRGLGEHGLTAVYSGDSSHAGAIAVQGETVALTPTFLSFSCSGGSGTASSIAPNQSLTLTATMTVPTGAAPPSGSVTFTDTTTNTTLGSAPIQQNGSQYQAILNTGLGAVLGYHTLSVVYAGDTTHAGAISNLSQLVAPAATTLSLTSSASGGSINPGQPVTFTATVHPSAGNGTPTGSVTFYDGLTALNGGQPVSLSGVAGNDTATLQVTLSSAGTHDVTALYNDTVDNSFAGSGNWLSQTVTGSSSSKASSISLVSSVNPSLPGQVVTYTATVTSPSGGGPPTGTVTFFDGGTSLGSGTLAVSGGKDLASVVVPSAQDNNQPLTLGTHDITAIYSGDSSFQASSASLPSPSTLQTVALLLPQESLAASPSSSDTGQTVRLTATVRNPSGGATPTGSILFYDGTTQLNSTPAQLSGSSGSASGSFSLSSLAVGSHDLLAVYSGDGSFQVDTASLPTSSSPFNVYPNTVSATLSASPNPSFPNQPVAATVTLTSISGGNPTGSVQLYDGGTPLGSALSLAPSGSNSATASGSASTLTPGGHVLTVVYPGDGTYPIVAATLPYAQLQTVRTVVPGQSLTATPGTTAQPGQSVTLTDTLTSVSGGGNPTGSITFLDGQTVLATVPLAVVNNNDQAQYVFNNLSPGKHDLAALYSGDSHYTNSSSALLETMLAATTTTLTPPSTYTPGQQATFTATVQPVAPVRGIPTGTVSLDNGTTFVTSQSLPVGQNQVSFTITIPSGTTSLASYRAIYNAASGGAFASSSTNAAFSPTFTEGTAGSPQVLAAFTDSDSNTNPAVYQASIAWGDGNTSSGLPVSYVNSSGNGGTFTVSGSHAYTDEGSYAGQVTVLDTADNSTQTLPVAITVNDAALSPGSPVSIQAVAGQYFQGPVARFTDANPYASASDFTAMIQWQRGGATTAGTVQPLSGGGFQVQGGNLYTSAGSQTATVTIQDAGGAITTLTTPATIAAPPLVVNPLSITEGQTYNGTLATFTPALSGGSYTATVGWGDGKQSQGTLTSNGQGGFTISGSHTYTDEPPAGTTYPLTVTVQPNTGTSGSPLSASNQVTVTDASLTPSSATLTAFTGTPTGALVAGSFTDANSYASTGDFTATINWGDNTTPTTGTVRPASGGGFQVVGNHTYQSAASYPVTIAVQDKGGANTTINSTANVTTATTSIQATEGAPFSGTVASFTSSVSGGASSATISWGDGSPNTPGSISWNGTTYTITPSRSHTYADEGTYPLSVTVQMSQGGPLTASGPASVADASLSGVASNQTATVGQPLGAGNSPVLLATFTDANSQSSASDFSATIQWGDGSTGTGTIQAQGNGVYQVLGSHTYVNPGTYGALVTLKDVGGSQASVTSTITTSLVEGQDDALSLTVAAPAGSGQQAMPGTVYTASITWGDGGVTPGTVSVAPASSGGGPLQLLVTGDHVYAEEGTYPASVTVSDPSNNQSTASTTVNVVDAPLAGGYGLPLTAVAGAPLSGVLLGGFSDTSLQGTAADFSVSISWGDGSGTDTTSGQLVARGPGSYQVTGSHGYTSAGSFPVTVTISDDGGQSTSFTGNAQVIAPWTALPGSGQVSADPANALMVPEGEATVDLGQGGLRLSHALDFDQSPGTSVGGDPALVYNSATVNVRPVIQLQIPGDVNASAPTQAVVQLTWNNVQQSAITYSLTQPAGSSYVFAVQPSSPVTATGQYSWSATVTFTFPDTSTKTTTASGTANVVVRDQGPYGAGWGIDGISQLYAVSGGVLFVTGQGDSRFFQSAGGGTFTSPAEDFGTLVQNQDGSYTYTDKSIDRYNYTSAGLLASIVDPHQLTLLSYLYDSQNRLYQVNALDGGVTTLSYDPTSGLLSQVSEPGGRNVLLTQTSGNLTQIQDADGTTRSLGYDTSHHLNTDTWSPLSALFSYDPTSGLLTQVNLGLGTYYNVAATAGVGLGTQAGTGSPWASITDALNHQTQYLLDNRGRLLQQTLADGTTTSRNVLDSAGQVAIAIDPLGRATLNTYVYGAYNPQLGGGAGDLIQTTQADGSWTKYVYDPTFHELLSTSNSLGETSSNTYDPGTGDLLSSTDALGNTTTYTYYQQNGISNGLVETVTTPMSTGPATTVYLYDNDRRQAAVFDNLGVPTWLGYDPSGNPAVSTDAYGRKTQTVYSPDNLLLQQTDAEGGVTSWTYNPYGQQTSETNPRSFTQTESYDQRGWQTQQTDNLGNVVETDTRDAAGNLVKQQDGDQNPTYYIYDIDNRQVSETDGLNDTTAESYNADSEVASTTDALQHKTTDSYNLLGQEVATTDPMGRTSRSLDDSAGNVLRSTDAMGQSIETLYNADNEAVQTVQALGNGQVADTQEVLNPDGSVAETIDPLGLQSFISYNPNGQETGTLDPMGFTTAEGYNLVGDVIWTRDADNQTTQYTYDALDRQITTLDPSNNLTQTIFDAVGNAVETIDAKNYTVQSTYDADNQVVSVLDGDQYLSKSIYDKAGNLTASMDNNGQWTYISYDADNRVVLVQDPNNHLTETSYNAVGDETATIDGAGDLTQTGYNADDQETSSQDGAGDTTSYGLNADGAQIAEIDPDHNTTQYALNAQGETVATLDPLGNSSTEVYDLDGRLISKTDRDGRTITYQYDNDSRVSVETWYNANGTVQDVKSYTYDHDGRLLTASDSSGTYTYTYYPNGNLHTQTDPNNLTLTYGYDGDNNVTSVQDSLGGTITKKYDNDSRLSSLQYTNTNGQQARQDMTYTKDGQLSMVTRYADAAGTQKVGSSLYTYDNANNLLQIQHQGGAGSALGTYTYAYDSANRLSSETVTENGGSPVTTNYSYDKASQLLTAGSKSYTYDANGNRTMSGYVTGPDNQVQNDGTWAYQYDKEGNTVLQTNNSTKETWSYTWDNANYLTSATHRDASNNLIEQVTYRYDVLGNLVERDDYLQSTGQTTVLKYAYDAEGNIWADLSSTGTLVDRRLFTDASGQTVPALRIDANGNVTWYLTDHLGSVRLLANNAASVIDQIDYDAFGNITSETQPSNGDRYKYASGQYDPSLQTTHFGNRWLQNGHWLSQDPTGLGPGPNPYEYTSNDPSNGIDPSGDVVIFVHGIRDTGKDWMEHLYYGMYTYWNKVGGPYQVGLQFRWPGNGRFLLNKPNTPNAFNAHATIKDTLKDDGCKQAVDQLIADVDRLRKIFKTNGIENEPINIVAHSQGTMIVLAALAQGMKIDKAIFMHSPYHKSEGQDDLVKALRNIKNGALWLFDSKDPWVTQVNGFPQGENGVPDSLQGAQRPSGISYKGFTPPSRLLDKVLPIANYKRHGSWGDPHLAVDGPFGGYGRLLSSNIDNYTKIQSPQVESQIAAFMHIYGKRILDYDNDKGVYVVPPLDK